MILRERNNVQCEWFKNPDKEWLKAVWLRLEPKSQANFFLSWFWIGTWLDSFVRQFYVLEARLNGDTVGLGIIVTKSCEVGIDRFRVKHYLHRTGIFSEDQIWIEYNDFLVSSHNSEQIRSAMFSSVAYWIEKNGAFIVGASKPELYSTLNTCGLCERKIWETNSYSLELKDFSCETPALLKSLSRNARYQITRSLRKYEDIGPITVNTMQTVKDALSLLQLAGPYHLARWGGESSGSGLANEKFVSFHTQLIRTGLPAGVIELHHIQAGNETIGIVYNFKYRSVIYFYFCAMNYSHSNMSSHYKPGLVSHYLLIEKAIKEGAERYDFMGGKGRYKRTFANKTGTLAVYQYEHNRWLLAIENYARELKHKLWTDGKPYSL
ncbi:GNAT family N-acetyltransferase [Vibrio ziniensis]|uniref:GNAT family N-acetyltransferase n=1 Tax=Vibrio ziniensis TaxID=2711221 RepID=A0A6G7CMI3_9VIBR|nr:GNAT family N-acetyltransferase [Vibrio ziniensis]QIH43305.1 GNAT family N-acetyltransferase [Vibrio ziniensis]